jgi:hypothetical protein
MLAAGLTVLAFSRMTAQAPAVSPRDSARAAFNGQTITIWYGKPAVRGRKVFGVVVPYYKVWRTGDREATVLRTDLDLEMEGAIVPRGSYSLYSIPAETRWKLIINKQTGQWGTVYDPRRDLARLDVAPKPTKAPAESLQFRIEKTGRDGGVIRIEWEQTSIAVPFRISRDTLVPSPRDSVELQVEGARLTVDYGRPSVRGRKIFGGIVPYGKIWRAGANAATGFVTTTDLLIGGVTVPKGKYTLYALPGSKEWMLIVNRQTGQWGTVYDAGRDLARVKMTKRLLREPVERFTIELVPQGTHGAVLRLMWERTLVTVPLKIK